MLATLFPRVAPKLLVFCAAWAHVLNPAMADTVYCGSRDSVLPPDFVEVREKLVRSVNNEDWTYFEALQAPGFIFAFEEIRDYLSISEYQPHDTRSALLKNRVLRSMATCTRSGQKVACSKTSRYHDPDVEPDPPRVVNVEGAYGRAHPGEDAPLTAYLACGKNVPSGKRRTVNAHDGKRWVEGRTYGTPRLAYFDVRDIEIVSGQQTGGSIEFERVGGLWRITGFFISSP